MRNNIQKNWGQSSLEYAVVVAVVVGALLTMQVYIKRAISGRLRSHADEIGQQYAPKNTTSDMTRSIESNVTTTVETGMVTQTDAITGETEDVAKTTTTVTITSEEEKVDGSETVGALGSSLF